jgi:hypothetical protein
VIPNRLAGQNKGGVFCESEGDFTSEMVCGQFSIFGAIEEKESAAAVGSTQLKRRLRDTAWML